MPSGTGPIKFQSVSIDFPNIAGLNSIKDAIQQIILNKDPIFCYALACGSTECANILRDLPYISIVEELSDGSNSLMLSVKVILINRMEIIY